MAPTLDILTWALASLGNSSSALNDFTSPAGFLTAALNSLIQNTPLNHAYVPSPSLPLYLPLNASGFPWENLTVSNTDPLARSSVPDTGVTRKFDLTITREIVAVDGFNKSAILVNKQYPGPLLEANWGDYIEVTLHNEISDPAEGTTIHLHGLTQNGTPWFDGTPGISQCPVAPGSTYIFRSRADMYGTSWYHSHYSAQYTAGVYGPLVVHGPSSEEYDIDIGPIMIHDYFRMDYQRILQNNEGSNALTALLNPSDNTLIHGGSNYACPVGTECHSNSGLSGFTFTPGKRHRLRIINTSTLTTPMLFTIDNHTMTVIANDFTSLESYTTDVLSLSSGQRTDIVVDATGIAGQSFWMRTRQPDLCSFTLQPFGLAAIYYTDAAASGANAIPTSTPPPSFNIPRLESCANDPLNTTTPSYPIPATSTPDTILAITSRVGLNATGSTVYTMNNSTYYADFNSPLLSLFASSTNSTPPSSSTQNTPYDLGSNRTIWLIFNNAMPFAHPMHLHGQQFLVLAEGPGTWDGTTITHAHNPQRRDTQIVQASGYAVFQLDGGNAGVWPFHCHLAWHLSSGMNVNLVMQADELRGTGGEIGEIVGESCAAWDAWSKGNRVDQIDSGI